MIIIICQIISNNLRVIQIITYDICFVILNWDRLSEGFSLILGFDGAKFGWVGLWLS
jgi:hypothetical protein